MIQKIKDLVLPLAIVLGFLFHRFIAQLNILTPLFIFIMLYLTLCSIDIKKMQITWFHIWILLFQLVLSFGLYLAIRPFNDVLAQGALAVVLAPTAISAPVIAAMLGANISTMITSTLLSNLAVAAVSPLYFSFAGTHADLPFLQSSWMVLSKVTPLIVMPLIMALLTQRFLPKLNTGITKRKNLPFYLWALSLTIVIGTTIEYIYRMDSSKDEILIFMGLLSILICITQFAFGRWIGKRYGDVVAGGQSVGQKNTVLAIWMAQTYLNPLSSVVPALYVLWQNLFNSFQMIQKSRNEKRK
jgi:bile acid:Na+ symporter, BASS family